MPVSPEELHISLEERDAAGNEVVEVLAMEGVGVSPPRRAKRALEWCAGRAPSTAPHLIRRSDVSHSELAR